MEEFLPSLKKKRQGAVGVAVVILNTYIEGIQQIKETKAIVPKLEGGRGRVG